jgi:hypothetical protein
MPAVSEDVNKSCFGGTASEEVSSFVDALSMMMYLAMVWPER